MNKNIDNDYIFLLSFNFKTIKGTQCTNDIIRSFLKLTNHDFIYNGYGTMYADIDRTGIYHKIETHGDDAGIVTVYYSINETMKGFKNE